MCEPAICKEHHWSMHNVRNGYLVVEGCFVCRGRLSFFSQEPVPPIDDYREGDHFWSYMGSYQAMKFDLKCDDCGEIVELPEVNALMLCTKCNPDCEAGKLYSSQPGKKPWVYLAICPNTSHPNGKCVPENGIKALNEYFNQGLDDPDKKIIVAPCIKRKSVDTCQGIYLADVGLTELY